MAKDIEIEIKVKVEKIEKLTEFLKKKATFKGIQHQKDEYFVPRHRNFLSFRPTNEWLRIRNSRGKVCKAINLLFVDFSSVTYGQYYDHIFFNIDDYSVIPHQ